MKIKLLPLLCALLLTALCFVQAATPLEPDAPASLTLHYQQEGAVFPGLEIRAYRVAQAFPNGIFQLLVPYATYPVNIHNITQQSQWQFVAATLCAYIDADQLPPDRVAETDSQGIARFTQLQTGLYLVRRAVGENASGIYEFKDFLVYVPTPQADGSYQYQVEAVPKCLRFTPKTQYSVTKLWEDAGQEAQRPKEVTVDIYRDGQLYETQVLNADNNWRYTWQVTGQDTAAWTVAERDVPQGYRVTVLEQNGAFSLVNARKTTPVTPPTGDNFSPLPWILALCASGLLLLILGLRRRK